MAEQIINVFGKIILMIAFGMLLTKLQILSEQMKQNLSTLLMKAVLPVNILSSAGQEFSKENGMGMVKMIIISGLYYIAALIVLTILAKKKVPKEKSAVFIDLAVFANVGFIGFPLLGEMLGNIGTLYTVAYNMVFQICFFSYGLFLMKGEGKLSISELFKSSIVYFSIASILLYFSNLRFPDFIQSAMSSIGSMMVPLSMIIIGYEIAVMDVKKLYKEGLAYLVSACRLVIFPILMLVAMKVFGVEHDVAVAATILTALPSGSLTVIAAQDYKQDSSLAVCGVAQSTMFMILTLPLITVLAEQIL